MLPLLRIAQILDLAFASRPRRGGLPTRPRNAHRTSPRDSGVCGFRGGRVPGPVRRRRRVRSSPRLPRDGRQTPCERQSSRNSPRHRASHRQGAIRPSPGHEISSQRWSLCWKPKIVAWTPIWGMKAALSAARCSLAGWMLISAIQRVSMPAACEQGVEDLGLFGAVSSPSLQDLADRPLLVVSRHPFERFVQPICQLLRPCFDAGILSRPRHLNRKTVNHHGHAGIRSIL